MTDVTVGQVVEYLLPENTSIGGVTLFDAEVTAVHEDGTVDLKFLPIDASSEYVERERVEKGIGWGQFSLIAPEQTGEEAINNDPQPPT
jgi:hypothetical protein